MRKLKACVQIHAPVQTVHELAGHRGDWLVTQGGVLLRTLSESWEATPVDGGTRFTLHVEYKSRLPFLDDLVAGDVHGSVALSLSRLKELAERVH